MKSHLFFFLMLHLTTTNMNVKSKVATHYYASTASNGISLKKSSICNQNVQACREYGPPKFQTYPDHHHLFVFTSQSKVSSFSLYFFPFLSLALIFLQVDKTQMRFYLQILCRFHKTVRGSPIGWAICG